MKKSDSMKDKLVEIQFLRVIAIFSVVIFHFSARRASELPYGQWVSGAPWSLGWLGVQLFFIVSGFVIAFSLQNTSTASMFLINRATRLYPALFLLLPFVFIVQRYTPNSPYVDRSTLRNLIGSITLIPPTVLNFFSDSGFDWLTLVLWSLKVEVFFYLLCAVTFAALGKSNLPAVLTIFSVLANLAIVLQTKIDLNELNFITKSIKVFGFDHLSWFVIGVLIFELRFKSKTRFMRIGLTVTSLTTLLNLYILNDSNLGVLLGGAVLMATALLFALFCVVKSFPLEKYILIIGDSSYEMYLVHQGVGLTLLLYVANRYGLGPVSGTLAGLFIIYAMTYLCHLIFTRITRPINSWARSALSRKWY
jgi:peptidoglycan/LPS O-acetylase OafA/YrhL